MEVLNSLYCARCARTLDAENITAYQNEILCEVCANKLFHELESQKKQFIGLSEFEAAAEQMIAGLKKMGMNIDIENFGGTPKRVARAYYEIFAGCENTEAKIANILSTAFPSDGFQDMITASGIVTFSMCPHHLLPVEYRICVGYIPNVSGKVLGLSKLIRLTELLAKRPVLQEQLTEDIVDALMTINPQGAAVTINGRHMCMRMRGAKAVNSSVKTMAVRGCFRDNIETRQEFIENTKNDLSFT